MASKIFGGKVLQPPIFRDVSENDVLRTEHEHSRFDSVPARVGELLLLRSKILRFAEL